jgi:hypothetical protein
LLFPTRQYSNWFYCLTDALAHEKKLPQGNRSQGIGASSQCRVSVRAIRVLAEGKRDYLIAGIRDIRFVVGEALLRGVIGGSMAPL